MPNWCTNTLNICGPVTEVDGFVKAVHNDEGNQEYTILESLYPVPHDLKDLPSTFGMVSDDDPDKDRKESNQEKYGAVDWYDWCCNNWGTKWADCHTEYICDDQSEGLKKVMFRFDSAWSPPINGFNAIATMFPKLVFDLRYEEPGMCYQGYKIWGNGESIAEAEMEYMSSGNMVFDTIDWDYKDYVGSMIS